MSRTAIPAGYVSPLNLYDTQSAIALIKHTFQGSLEDLLQLKRVSAPLFVDPSQGLNDNLNGVERPVCFDIPQAHLTGEVVHSLAKWKRYALHRYGFHPGKGLYTDMNAIRRDEALDNLHSVYVDQWDWEKIITPEQRNEAFLRITVQSIVDGLCYTNSVLRARYPQLHTQIEQKVTFITAQELLDKYPALSPKERETAFCREYGTVFVQGIGNKLSNGLPHDGRAPDYDDWSLNGDILCYYPLLDTAFELSSMGIRVDPVSLKRQLTLSGCEERAKLPFHQALLEGKLPLTMGGGIGQSRLCMFILGKAHIGEVQSSLWDEATLTACEAAGVTLL